MNPVGFLVPASIREKIRIGNNHNGGYVVYGRLLAETDVLLSYGVGWDTAFEEHFHRITGKDAFMFDPTMFSGRLLLDIRYLLKLAGRFELRMMLSYLLKVAIWCWKRKLRRPGGLHFIREGIASEQKPHFNTMEEHIRQYGLDGKNILLKMDIEGGEYVILENRHTLAALKNVNQIVIEWHDLKTRLRELKATLTLLKNEFEIVHVHSNNWGIAFKLYDFCNDEMKDILLPDVLEMTLVRRDCIFPADLLKVPVKYPVEGLDYPNNPRMPDFSPDFITG